MLLRRCYCLRLRKIGFNSDFFLLFVNVLARIGSEMTSSKPVREIFYEKSLNRENDVKLQSVWLTTLIFLICLFMVAFLSLVRHTMPVAFR